MKFRIREQRFPDGIMAYTAQRRRFFIWYDLKEGDTIKELALRCIENYKTAYVKYHYIKGKND